MSNPLNCAVFGANGYLGRHITLSLTGMGFNVFNYDIHNESVLSNYSKLDICQRGEFEILPQNLDKIYFFAGITGTHDSLDNYQLYLKVNELGLLNLLNFIVTKSPSSHLIYPSTRLVYKGSAKKITEDHKKEPKTIYAVNKLAAENYITAFSNYYGTNYTIFRICIPYGNLVNTGYSYGTIGLFLKQIKKTGIITLFGNGKLRRTFTHIEDLCHQIIVSSFIEQSKNQIFNVDGEDYSLSDIANMIAIKYSGRVEYTDWNHKDYLIESGDTVFDATKLKTILPYTICKTFKNWLENLEDN